MVQVVEGMRDQTSLRNFAIVILNGCKVVQQYPQISEGKKICLKHFITFILFFKCKTRDILTQGYQRNNNTDDTLKNRETKTYLRTSPGNQQLNQNKKSGMEKPLEKWCELTLLK